MKFHTAIRILENHDEIDYGDFVDPIRTFVMDRIRRHHGEDFPDSDFKFVTIPMVHGIGGTIVTARYGHDEDGNYDVENLVVWPDRSSYDASLAKIKSMYPDWKQYRNHKFGPAVGLDKYGVTNGYLMYDVAGYPQKLADDIEVAAWRNKRPAVMESIDGITDVTL